eukprot:5307557-Prymnesium_polylepis.1
MEARQNAERAFFTPWCGGHFRGHRADTDYRKISCRLPSCNALRTVARKPRWLARFFNSVTFRPRFWRIWVACPMT